MSGAHSSSSVPPRRWPQTLLGLSQLVFCAALALGSAFLPYVTIQAPDQTFTVGGAEQTGNLHLVLVVAGCLGIWMSLSYALSARPRPAWFLTLGGIALAVAAFLTLEAQFTVSQGWVRSAKVYSALGPGEAPVKLGGAVFVALGCALGVTLLGLVMSKRRRPAMPSTPPRPAR